MKSFIKISIYILTVAGLILLALPPSLFPSFYDVRYMGVAMLCEVALIYFVPKMLNVPDHIEGADQKNKSINKLQFLISLTFMANGLGDIGLYQLYKVGFEFDKFLHFYIPMLSVFFISMVAFHRFELRRSSSVLMGFIITIIIGALWELFEYGVDYYFKTRLHGINGINMANDTEIDLLLDTIGAISGIAVSTRALKPIIDFNQKITLLKLKH